MISALIRSWNSLEMAQARARHLPGRVRPYVPAGGAVLDVGCGNGFIAHSMLRDGGAGSVQGVDVVLQPDPMIPVTAFDGEHLPFGDGAFDLVTLVDVLHHTDDPAPLLREAMRVSRGPVMVKDHYWISRLDRWILHFADYLGNKPYGIALPFNFLRMEQWAVLFAQLNLTVRSMDQFCYAPYDRAKQVIFLLEPSGE